MSDSPKLSRAERRRKERESKGTLDDMIQCPYCHAMGYPLTFKTNEAQSEDEANAIICPSCGKDMYPYMKMAIDAWEQVSKEVDEEIEQGKWENPLDTPESHLHVDYPAPKKKVSTRKKKTSIDTGMKTI